MNNRQNGRRRGRGGQQTRNGQPGNIDRGNRIDNRARGNAAQLLEKYKNLARDAQMQGDRVNTEYYLQFADHYFRVLSENRARFEEQRGGDQQPQQRGRRDEFRDDFGQDGDDGDSPRFEGDQSWNDDGDDRQSQPDRNDQRSEQPRQDRSEQRQDRSGQLRRPRYDQPVAQASDEDGGEAEAPRAERRPRRERAGRDGANGANGYGHAANEENEGVGTEPVSERIEIDRLPQALSPAPSNDDNDAEVAPRPRRTRRPRAETSAVES